MGATELIARYRDAPVGALTSLPAAFYIVVNAAAAIVALLCIRAVNWRFGFPATDTDGLRLARIGAAGFGAVLVLRSTFFIKPNNSGQNYVGVNAVIQTLLRAADDAIDRKRTIARTAILHSIRELTFEQAELLPAYCMGLMHNTSPEDQRALGTTVRELKESGFPDEIKCDVLGSALLDLTGPELLENAVGRLKAAYAAPVTSDDPAGTRAASPATSDAPSAEEPEDNNGKSGERKVAKKGSQTKSAAAQSVSSAAAGSRSKTSSGADPESRMAARRTSRGKSTETPPPETPRTRTRRGTASAPVVQGGPEGENVPTMSVQWVEWLLRKGAAMEREAQAQRKALRQEPPQRRRQVLPPHLRGRG